MNAKEMPWEDCRGCVAAIPGFGVRRTDGMREKQCYCGESMSPVWCERCKIYQQRVKILNTLRAWNHTVLLLLNMILQDL